MAFDAFLIFRTSDQKFVNETADLTFGNLSGRAVMPLKSFSLGAVNNVSPASGGSGSGKVTYNGLGFTKDFSINSPLLLGLCDTSKALSQVTLALRQSSQGVSNASGVFAVYTFATVVISSYSSDGSVGDALPTDTLHLVAAQYALNTYSSNPKTTAVITQASGWDVARNVSWTPSVIDSPHP